MHPAVLASSHPTYGKMTCTKSEPLDIFDNLIGRTAAVERQVAAVSREFRAAAMTAPSLPASAALHYFLMRATV